MSGGARRPSHLAHPSISLLALSLCAFLATSCTGSATPHQSQDISIYAPPSLQSEVAAIGRSYSAQGYGQVTVQTFDGSSVVAR